MARYVDKSVDVILTVSVRREPSCLVSTNTLSGHFRRSGFEVPRQKFVDAVDGMVGDAGEHLPQIGFGIETIELRRTDQAVDGCGALAARIRSRKQVILPAQGHATQ